MQKKKTTKKRYVDLIYKIFIYFCKKFKLIQTAKIRFFYERQNYIFYYINGIVGFFA